MAWGFAPEEKITYRMMKIASITIGTSFILNFMHCTSPNAFVSGISLRFMQGIVGSNMI